MHKPARMPSQDMAPEPASRTWLKAPAWLASELRVLLWIINVFNNQHIIRSLGSYGARCVRSLWKISGLIVDCLIRFGRLFNERLLRRRGGSICCAVSCRYRNAFRLFRKTLCTSLLRPWAGKECLTPPRRRRGAREGRARQESLERAPSRSDGYTIIPTS